MTDMKKIYMLALVLIIGICTGCSKENIEIDFDYDYSEEIKVSLQEELTNIEKITQKYTPLAEAAQTQGEMNVAASSELFSGGNYKKQGLCSCKRVSENKRGRLCYAGSIHKVRKEILSIMEMENWSIRLQMTI